MSEQTWTREEKAIARRAFDLALGRELAAVVQEVKRRVAGIEQASELWELEEFLTQRRREIDERYDYRYSVLLLVFANLLLDGLIQEDDLKGLAKDKLKHIFGLVEFGRSSRDSS